MPQKRREAPRPPSPIERLDWDLLRTLLACARAGQIGAAARRLATDASTVSRRLTRLEEELGLTLFERGRHGLTPTAAAEPLLPAAEAVERAIQGVARAVDAVEVEAEGLVRVTAPPGVADAFLAPMLGELRARYPRIVLELDARVSVVDLTRGEADLALRTIRPRSGDLVMTRLAEVRSVPMASAAYAEELGRLRALDAARWVMWGRELAHLPEQRWLDAHVHGPPALRTSHLPSQIAATRAGVGAVLLPAPYAEVYGLAMLAPGKAVAPAWAGLPVGELWLVGHQALRQVPRIAAVWDLIVERMTLSSPRAS